MSALRTKPLYFWLLQLFFLFHNYNCLFGFIVFTKILQFGALMLLVSTAIFISCRLALKNLQISALVGFLIVWYNLFFGPIHDTVKAITHSSVVSSYKIFIPLSTVLLISITNYLFKRRDLMIKVATYLNVLLLTLCFLECVFAIKNLNDYFTKKNLIYSNFDISNDYTKAIPDHLKPNIYFIVYDEYTNNETLNQIWHFDNTEITDWLQHQGFFVSTNSKSNYNFTPFSLSSALNMNYLDSGKERLGNVPLYMLQAAKSLSHNQTFAILKKEGYQIRFFAPFENDIEHSVVNYEFGDFQNKQLYNSLLIYRVYRDIFWRFPNNKISELLEKIFSSDYNNTKKKLRDINIIIQKVKSVAQYNNEKPRFVYAHLMITHEPHLFDSNGRLVETTGGDSVKVFNSYPDQVRYANNTIRELVNSINAKTKKKSIIIITGDHGFRRLPKKMLGFNFPIFLAVYFPEKNFSTLYDGISPVNIFRKVFNEYFDQHFPMLKDSSIAVNYK